MGWDSTEWNGIEENGMEGILWDGKEMECNCNQIGWDGMVQDEMGWNGRG